MPGAVQFCGAEGQETRAAPSTASVQRSHKKHRPSLSMSAQSRPSPNTTSPPLRSQALDTFFPQRFLYVFFFAFFNWSFVTHSMCFIRLLTLHTHCNYFFLAYNFFIRLFYLNKSVHVQMQTKVHRHTSMCIFQYVTTI